MLVTFNAHWNQAYQKMIVFSFEFQLKCEFRFKCFLLDIILNQYCMFAAGWVIDEQIYPAWVRLSLITVVPSFTVTPLGAILTWHLVLWCSFVSISTVRYAELSLRGMGMKPWMYSPYVFDYSVPRNESTLRISKQSHLDPCLWHRNEQS